MLGVDREGDVDPREVEAVTAGAGDRFALLAVMLANNEVGTVQDIRALAEIAAEYGTPVVVIDEEGLTSIKPFAARAARPCLFEYVYFAHTCQNAGVRTA